MYLERNKRAEPPRENLIPRARHVLREHELARRCLRGSPAELRHAYLIFLQHVVFLQKLHGVYLSGVYLLDQSDLL